MRLYLIRHGEAAPEEVDPNRPLTPKGRRQAERVASFLRPLGISVSAVWHSGKLRAAQTAEILASGVNSTSGVLERKGLGPMDPVDPVREAVEKADGDLMVVGHLPLLEKLASSLVLGSEDRDLATFLEVSAVCLEGGRDPGWRIAWMVSPETLP